MVCAVRARFRNDRRDDCTTPPLSVSSTEIYLVEQSVAALDIGMRIYDVVCGNTQVFVWLMQRLVVLELL